MKCNIKYLGVFNTPKKTKEAQMTGIIPFFHLEDPYDIRERLSIKARRKHHPSKPHYSPSKTEAQSLARREHDLPGQLYLLPKNGSEL